MVDEVLVSAKTSPRVPGQRVRGLLFRADGAGNRQVARRKWNAHRRTDADRRVEKTKYESDCQHHQNAGAPAAPRAAAPRTVASSAAPLVAHSTLSRMSLAGRRQSQPARGSAVKCRTEPAWLRKTPSSASTMVKVPPTRVERSCPLP